MDAWEATKMVFDRVRMLDPDNASKIMGLLLIQDNSDKELIRLAFGPDHLLHAFVATARVDLATKPVSPLLPMLSSPLGDVPIPMEGEVATWRPCIYFARGYCKYGSSCRFLHCLPEDNTGAVEEREMAVMRAKALTTAQSQQLTTSSFPFSPSTPKGVSLNFLLQQQHEQQRAAAGMLLGSEDMHRFPMQSPQMNRGELTSSPASRQIYLTFPADSTFSEEDVSNYFSMYGPVQDVRIPYQQKRMFGFVTSVYAETVKIILNKGNPHFVCNTRMLVKPYKEKRNVSDRFRKLQHAHHGDFVGCTSPTGLLDSREPFNLQQPQIGPKMMCGNIANHEAFLRRKLEEQQQAAELQQAMELEGRRFVRLQLLDLKSRGRHLGSPIGSPMPLGQANGKGSANGNGNAIHVEEDVTIQDSKMNSTSLVMSAPVAATISATDEEGKYEEHQEEDGDASPKQVVNPGEEKRESGPVTATPNFACEFQESDVVEHILPESPFASPTKGYTDTSTTTSQNGNSSNISPHHVASSLFPHTSTLALPPYNSCFFQVPRFSPGHEAIGM